MLTDRTVRSLREAPELARAMAGILKKDLPVAETSTQVWEALWPQEKRRQVPFLFFGSYPWHHSFDALPLCVFRFLPG